MIGYINKVLNNNSRPKKAQTVPASLFWREQGMGIFGKSGAKYVNMPFDLFINEKHKLQYKVSDHPLQDGATVSDHVYKDLREVNVEGLFTNHPLKGFDEINEVKFKEAYATKNVNSSVTNRALAKFNELVALAEKKQPVRLICSLATYPKMIITDLSYERDAKSGSSVRFTMTLREIKTVQLKTVTGTYNFQPKEMLTANDKLIAAEIKSGRKTAEQIEAKQLLETLNMTTGGN